MSTITPNPSRIIKNMGINELNEVQKATIDAAKNNRNIQLIAPTGSGKTLAYCLAALPFINNSFGVQCLIIAPTRELVIQIESVLKSMKLGIKINAAYGGHSFAIEQQNFTNPPKILVGTPGRLEDHLNRKTLNPNAITQVIFDEYDKSLEFGFEDQMASIMRRLKHVEKHFLISATNSISIPRFLNITDLKKIEFKPEENKNRLSFKQLKVPEDEKLEGLVEVLSLLKEEQNAIVFVNHREAAERIGIYLKRLDVRYSIFHGGLKQDQRELQLIKFRNGSSNILVATDMAGRGLDIPDLDMVVHYQMPTTNAVFTHRNGRTARMNASGSVILLLTCEEEKQSFVDHEVSDLKTNDTEVIPQTKWTTLFIGKGKKDKINKIDIVGYLSNLDFMQKTDIGLIEVLDHTAYVAVNSAKLKNILKQGHKVKIKGKMTKIERAKG